ncbi:hypothetical protein MUO14_06725 [Halobacillus shinanisalinarum]|uniref:DUF3955 domain-containing protein n=1 Tax=Halobacillus shinanisalinarum TaxID=2932258 RepID=A0ABY4H4Y4_9BACI|nr:hypothetical protein [Halobacillus shinanisalinarum]UOQ94637.1 hypothetical protein MUO14_06725 [Halobacillus shinanisalinarum]
MKVLLIFLFTLLGMISIHYGMDLLMGFDRSIAIINLFNPFWVMTPFGYLLITVLFLSFFFSLIISFIRKKSKG